MGAVRLERKGRRRSPIAAGHARARRRRPHFRRRCGMRRPNREPAPPGAAFADWGQRLLFWLTALTFSSVLILGGASWRTSDQDVLAQFLSLPLLVASTAV